MGSNSTTEGSNKLSVTPVPLYEPPTGYPPVITMGELLQLDLKGCDKRLSHR